jgi:NADH-quinone oxidoreductase subunit N
VFVSAETVRLLSPEFVLMISATLICVGGAFLRSRAIWSMAAMLAFVVAGGCMMYAQPSGDTLSAGPVIMDGLALSLRWLLLLAGVFFVSLAWQGSSSELNSEHVGLVMFAVVGAMLCVGAGDLILLFLGLELISIPTYALLFIGRKDRESSEAAAKYFFLSILSSGILLYGMSFLYGLGGTTAILGSAGMDGDNVGNGLRGMILGLKDSPLVPLAPLALLLIIVGLGFKLAAVPFHFYAPDVYQGTTSGNAALLATLPKIAASAGIVRIIMLALPIEANHAWQVLLVLSLLSMTLGNVCALWQKNVRRMLAYSSIAHSGYMLIGMTVAQAGIALGGEKLYEGITGLVFYLAVYTFGSLGSFAALSVMGRNGGEVQGIDELAGAGRTQPLTAAALAIFMFSLAGIPPLAGFWGKFTLFTAAIGFGMQPLGQASLWMILLAVCGALNAAVGAAYYLRIVGVMYFQPAASSEPQSTQPGGALATTLACALLVIAAGVWPASVMRGARSAEQSVSSEISTRPTQPLAVANPTP